MLPRETHHSISFIRAAYEKSLKSCFVWSFGFLVFCFWVSSVFCVAWGIGKLVRRQEAGVYDDEESSLTFPIAFLTSHTFLQPSWSPYTTPPASDWYRIKSMINHWKYAPNGLTGWPGYVKEFRKSFAANLLVYGCQFWQVYAKSELLWQKYLYDCHEFPLRKLSAKYLTCVPSYGGPTLSIIVLCISVPIWPILPSQSWLVAGNQSGPFLCIFPPDLPQYRTLAWPRCVSISGVSTDPTSEFVAAGPSPPLSWSRWVKSVQINFMILTPGPKCQATHGPELCRAIYHSSH